ncbi:MAG: HAD family hydrolase [Nocardioides sp.]
MIRHVLLDADGVLQRHATGWVTALRTHLGDRAEAFLADVAADEQPCLRGHGDFLAVLATHLERYAVSTPADEVYADVWLRVAVEPTTATLVAGLRDHGLGVHLATNQQPRRAAYLREVLGYDKLVDQSFYSCDVGAAKPEEAFFAVALDALGASAPEVLLVDDHAGNVAGAREVGLAAEQWHADEGLDTLRDRLAAHGVVL